MRSKEAEGNHPAWANTKVTGLIQMDLTISSQTNCASIYCLNHGLPTTHLSSFEVQDRTAVVQCGNIGGGTTHVNDKDISHIR
ncbi:unnamed protein product [marine sediment metagenome]|uniref:Uncharacterized protein n=1 Tax=marine sediment metagenome TaxID=412755 RepID=X1SVD4_9ZZZZ